MYEDPYVQYYTVTRTTAGKINAGQNCLRAKLRQHKKPIVNDTKLLSHDAEDRQTEADDEVHDVST